MPRLPIIPQVGVQSPVTQVSAPSMAQAMPQLPAQNVALENATNQWGKTLGSIALQRQDEDNETAVRAFAAAYTEKASRSSAEFHGLIGGEAVSGYDKFVKSLDDERNSIVGKLPNEMQRRMFEKVALDTKSQIVSRATVHREKQRFAEDYGRREARATAMEGAFVEAVRNSDDSPESLLAVREAGDALRASHLEVAAISQLAGDEARSLFLKSRMAAVHDQVAEALLLANNPEKAAQHLADAEAAGEYNIGGKQGEMGIRLAQWKKASLNLAAQAQLANAVETAIDSAMSADPEAPINWTGVTEAVMNAAKANNWPAEHTSYVLKQHMVDTNWQVARRYMALGKWDEAKKVMQHATARGEFGPAGNEVYIGITNEEKKRDVQGRAARIQTLMGKVRAGVQPITARIDGDQPSDQALADFTVAQTYLEQARTELYNMGKDLHWHESVLRQKDDQLKRQYHQEVAWSFYQQGRPEDALRYLEDVELSGGYSPDIGGYSSTGFDEDTTADYSGGGYGSRSRNVASAAARAVADKVKKIESAQMDKAANDITTELIGKYTSPIERRRKLLGLGLPRELYSAVSTRLQAQESDEAARRDEEGAVYLSDLEARIRESRTGENPAVYALSQKELDDVKRLNILKQASTLLRNQSSLDADSAVGNAIALMSPEELGRTFPTQARLEMAMVGHLSDDSKEVVRARYAGGSVGESDIKTMLGLELGRRNLIQYQKAKPGEESTSLTAESSNLLNGLYIEVKRALSGSSPTVDRVSEITRNLLDGGKVVSTPEGTFEDKTARFIWQLTDDQKKEYGVPALPGARIEGDVFTLDMADSEVETSFMVNGKLTTMTWRMAKDQVLTEAANSLRTKPVPGLTQGNLITYALHRVQAMRADAIASYEQANPPPVVRGGWQDFVDTVSGNLKQAATSIGEAMDQVSMAIPTPAEQEVAAQKWFRDVSELPLRVVRAKNIAGPIDEFVTGVSKPVEDVGNYIADQWRRTLNSTKVNYRDTPIGSELAKRGVELRRILGLGPTPPPPISAAVAGGLSGATAPTISADASAKGREYTQAQKMAVGKNEAYSAAKNANPQDVENSWSMWNAYEFEYTKAVKANSPKAMDEFAAWRASWYDSWSVSPSTLLRMEREGGAPTSATNAVSIPELLKVVGGTRNEPGPILQIMAAIADGASRDRVAKLVKSQGELGYWTPEEVAMLADAVLTDGFVPQQYLPSFAR